MNSLLIFFEILWLLYFVSINIATYAIASDGTVIIERAVRQDVFNLGTHIPVLLVTIHGKCAPWMLILIGFEMFRDMMNAVNLQIFSPLKAFNYDLWVGAIVLGWYQTALSLVGFVYCAWNQQKQPVEMKIKLYKNKN